MNPQVSHFGLDRCLRRHGLGNLRDLQAQSPRPKHKAFKAYEPGYLHVDVKYLPHTPLPLDDCLYALQPTIPQLSRSFLHRCLQRHDISRLPEIEGHKPVKKKFKAYPPGYFHVDIAEVQTAEGKLYIFVAIRCPAGH